MMVGVLVKAVPTRLEPEQPVKKFFDFGTAQALQIDGWDIEICQQIFLNMPTFVSKLKS
jgi:hypothetical protein